MQRMLTRAEEFCQRFGLDLPILLAPMAGASAPALSIAVANAGGLGACGALLMQPAAILAWAAQVRAGTNGAFQLNLWMPDPPPQRDPEHEAQVREFLANWGPPVVPSAGDAAPLDFTAQCDALLAAAPPIVSSVMGLYPPAFVAQLKAKGIAFDSDPVDQSWKWREAWFSDPAGNRLCLYWAGENRRFPPWRLEHE